MNSKFKQTKILNNKNNDIIIYLTMNSLTEIDFKTESNEIIETLSKFKYFLYAVICLILLVIINHFLKFVLNICIIFDLFYKFFKLLAINFCVFFHFSIKRLFIFLNFLKNKVIVIKDLFFQLKDKIFFIKRHSKVSVQSDGVKKNLGSRFRKTYEYKATFTSKESLIKCIEKSYKFR